MELYREDGSKAGLYDICDWWIETYPPDVFVNEPKPIVEARMCMQNILIKRVKVVPSSNNDFKKPCPECDGKGEVRSVTKDLDGYDLEDCPDCKGQGFIKL